MYVIMCVGSKWGFKLCLFCLQIGRVFAHIKQTGEDIINRTKGRVSIRKILGIWRRGSEGGEGR